MESASNSNGAEFESYRGLLHSTILFQSSLVILYFPQTSGQRTYCLAPQISGQQTFVQHLRQEPSIEGAVCRLKQIPQQEIVKSRQSKLLPWHHFINWDICPWRFREKKQNLVNKYICPRKFRENTQRFVNWDTYAWKFRENTQKKTHTQNTFLYPSTTYFQFFQFCCRASNSKQSLE